MFAPRRRRNNDATTPRRRRADAAPTPRRRQTTAAGHTHKVVAGSDISCYEQHKAELDALLTVNGRHLAQAALQIGAEWVETFQNVTKAAAKKPHVLYYEALQRDPRAEVGRLFALLGLPGKAAFVNSTSTKITSDDLSQTLADFPKIVAALGAVAPGLVPQLVDASSDLFTTIQLPGNRTASFRDFEADLEES